MSEEGGYRMFGTMEGYHEHNGRTAMINFGSMTSTKEGHYEYGGEGGEDRRDLMTFINLLEKPNIAKMSNNIDRYWSENSQLTH